MRTLRLGTSTRLLQAARLAKVSRPLASHIVAQASASLSRPPANLEAQMKDLSGFIARAKECNTGLEELPTLTPFVVEGKEVGKLKPK